MDNNDQKKNPSGLTDENLKWLEEMMGNTTPVPASTQEPAQEKTETVNDKELDAILATDWDHIDLKETDAVLEENAKESITVEEILDEAEKQIEESAPKETSTDEVADDQEEDAVAEPQQEAVNEATGRPKKQDSYGMFGIPHIFSTLIWLVLIVAIGLSLGRVLWVCCADVMAFGKKEAQATIIITEEDDIDSIAKKLGDADLVKYPRLFKFFATVTGKDDDICVGSYTISSQLDYNAMINAMYSSDAKRQVVEIMFPEGVNCAQIFKALEEKGVCSAVELEEYAAEGELNDYWFLEGVTRGDKYCLEGYLAPDTYAFYIDDSPRRVLEKFLTEFDSRFTDKMKDNFQTMQADYAARLRKNGFSEAYIKENTLTLHQVVTLASIIQKETSSDDEGYKIAAVFYARLCDPKIMSLGADITVHYALGDYFYDIKELTAEQLEFESPYNTRKNKGIPPGPICNMGAQSLYAALEPNTAYYDYRYFVYDRENKVHVFTKTEKEHDKKKEELGY